MPAIVKRAGVGVVLGEPVLMGEDAICGLTGLCGLGGGEVVETSPGVGFDVGEGFVFLNQIVERPRQQRVLVNIGQIPGVEGVLV